MAGKKEVRGVELNVAGAAEVSGVCVAVEVCFCTTQLTEFHHLRFSVLVNVFFYDDGKRDLKEEMMFY